NGLVAERTDSSLRMFDLAWVGVPVAVVGLVFIVATTRWLLPERKPPMARLRDPREYSVEMLVDPEGPLVGRTIENAGLRHLSGMFLAEIDRDGQILPAVSPRERLQSGDRLVFVGVVDSVVELQKIRGLTPATDQVFKLEGLRSERIMVEAVVSGTCPVAGRTIRDGDFRSRYDAVVIAVARNGERLGGKIGDIVIQPGDTLLLEAKQAFLEQQRNNRDFFLVSQVEDSSPPRHERAPVAMLMLAVMVVTAGAGWLSLLEAALLAGGGMLITGCCSVETARRNIDWSVILVIAAAFGLGEAMAETGVAREMAVTVIDLAGVDPLLNLAAIYLLTALFTAVLTNNAAALLMFPIAMAVAGDLNVSVMPFVVAIMMAASASFATPIGYQTNLMVYGPGGYRFSDFLRMGLPLNLVTAVMAVLIIPWVWGF
ncbi:MAG: SLC13 family permease, partial [Ectothiorhodospiraceae bacterium]